MNTGKSISLKELIQLRSHARGLTLGHHKRVLTERAGTYISSIKGRGIDFTEVRAYQNGDDIRNMDWRVTARTGKPHTKLYQEEKERPVLLLVDQSPSMFFATRVAYKSVIASQLATLIAWAASAQGDKVGGLILSGDQHAEIRPALRHSGVLAFLKCLADVNCKPSTTISGEVFNTALLRLRHVAKPSSLIFLISDFNKLSYETEKHLAHLSKHSQIFSFYIYDPLEARLPPPNSYTITDGITLTQIDTYASQFRQAYQDEFEKNHRKLAKIFGRLNIPCIDVATTTNLRQLLLNVLGGEH